MMQAALNLEPMPLNQEDWNRERLVEETHEGLLFREIALLRDSRKGSEQWQEVIDWMEAPVDKSYPPFTFATCCKVCGIDDSDSFRESIYRQLGLT